MRKVVVDREFWEWILGLKMEVRELYWVLVREDMCFWGLVV